MLFVLWTSVDFLDLKAVTYTREFKSLYSSFLTFITCDSLFHYYLSQLMLDVCVVTGHVQVTGPELQPS